MKGLRQSSFFLTLVRRGEVLGFDRTEVALEHLGLEA
jgi:hypothetical protein